MKILVTGGAGFIGSAFVRGLLEGSAAMKPMPGVQVVVLDALTYAGNFENLAGLEGREDFHFLHGSIVDEVAVAAAVEGCRAIVNFAAETHVDRSLLEPGTFVETNVQGTRVLLDAARRAGARFVQVSTDEVYGSLGEDGLFREDSPLSPSSPYAASKAAADLLVGAWVVSYGVDAVVTRCGNNYGPRQFPEKLIPLFVTSALEDRELPLYGDGLNVRDWIHVDDHAAAVRAVLEQGVSGRVYNVSAGCEVTNVDLVRRLLAILDKPWSLVRPVRDRPGHDRRYALDASRLRDELDWQPSIPFEEGLATTVAWYLANTSWCEHVRSGAYLDYYERQYGERLRGA
jgi:dTDP-glucose 4,6-dehydratase